MRNNALSKVDAKPFGAQLRAMHERFGTSTLQEEILDVAAAAQTATDELESASLDGSAEVLGLITQNHGEKLQSIEEALQRIADGTYGRCTNCLGKISRTRLQALPDAPHCIECQRKLEKEQSLTRTGVGELLQRNDD